MTDFTKIGPSVLSALLPRPSDSHKGTFGTLTMLCGSDLMPGAARLAADAALRSGVGLLRIACPAAVRQVLQAALAEPVWLEPESVSENVGTAFLAGCGLGPESFGLLASVLPKIECPAVYDAGALRFFASNPEFLCRLSGPAVLTPHPGEFCALTGLSVGEIRSSREQIASSFAKDFGCTVVLKGKGTVVALPDGSVSVNTTGSSALAKGGSGDVLAGVIASLLAQGHSCGDSARIGVFVHGLAGDNLEKRIGDRAVLPRDLPAEIGSLLRSPPRAGSVASTILA